MWCVKMLLVATQKENVVLPTQQLWLRDKVCDKYISPSTARPGIGPLPRCNITQMSLNQQRADLCPNRLKWAKKIVLEGLEQRG